MTGVVRENVRSGRSAENFFAWFDSLTVQEGVHTTVYAIAKMLLYMPYNGVSPRALGEAFVDLVERLEIPELDTLFQDVAHRIKDERRLWAMSRYDEWMKAFYLLSTHQHDVLRLFTLFQSLGLEILEAVEEDGEELFLRMPEEQRQEIALRYFAHTQRFPFDGAAVIASMILHRLALAKFTFDPFEDDHDVVKDASNQIEG